MFNVMQVIWGKMTVYMLSEQQWLIIESTYKKMFINMNTITFLSVLSFLDKDVNKVIIFKVL